MAIFNLLGLGLPENISLTVK